VAAGKTDTFLGERYRRIARRRGKKKAIVAVGRSILVIVWHLLSDPETRYHDLGSDFYDNRIGPERKKRNGTPASTAASRARAEAVSLHRFPWRPNRRAARRRRRGQTGFDFGSVGPIG